MLASRSQKTLLLEDTDALSADLELNLLAINNDSLGLQVRVPYLLGVALREADVIAKLLAFVGDITFTHVLTFLLYSRIYFIGFCPNRQYALSILQRGCYTVGMFTGYTGFDIVALLASLITALACHEAMHAYVAHALGDRTAHEEGRLTLNPLKHIDMFTSVLLPFVLIMMHLPPFFAAKPVPFNPSQVRWGEYGVALVGVAGPFTNLFLAAFTAVIIKGFDVGVGTGLYQMLATFVQVNIGFFVFNMIPIPPLDGSRLLYAFAPDPIRRVMEAIESIGFLAIIMIMLLVFSFFAPIIANITTDIYTFLLR